MIECFVTRMYLEAYTHLLPIVWKLADLYLKHDVSPIINTEMIVFPQTLFFGDDLEEARRLIAELQPDKVMA